MSIVKELLGTIRTLGALEKRTDDVVKSLQTLNQKIDKLSEQVIRLESDQKHIRESVRNEILADIKGELVKVKIQNDLNIEKLNARQITSE